MICKRGYLAALLALVVMGCGGHEALSVKDKQDGKTFWTHRYQYVRLVPQDHCPGQETVANSHPQDLGGRLRTMLESLQIYLPEQEKSAPVFTRAELGLVTGPLLQAFKQAAPDEDVALVIEGMHPGKYGLQRCVVTARLFVQNGDELHVIFGKLHVPMDSSYGWNVEPPDYRLSPFAPGSRCQKAGEKFPDVIATQIVRFHEQEGTPRKNWLTVSLSSQPQAPQIPTTMAQPAAPQIIQEPAPMAKPAAPQRPTMTPLPAEPQTPVVVTPPPVQRSEGNILEKLQILKDLRVKGLITEQEYQEKKKEILDRL